MKLYKTLKGLFAHPALLSKVNIRYEIENIVHIGTCLWGRDMRNDITQGMGSKQDFQEEVLVLSKDQVFFSEWLLAIKKGNILQELLIKKCNN